MEYFIIIIIVDFLQNGEAVGDRYIFFLVILSFGSPFWRNFEEALGDALRDLN